MRRICLYCGEVNNATECPNAACRDTMARVEREHRAWERSMARRLAWRRITSTIRRWAAAILGMAW